MFVMKRLLQVALLCFIQVFLEIPFWLFQYGLALHFLRHPEENDNISLTMANMSIRHSRRLGRKHPVAIIQMFDSAPHARWANRRLAILLGRVAVACDPSSSHAYAALGHAYEQAGDSGQARDIYRQGLEVIPDDGQLWYRLGYVEWLDPDDHYPEAEAAFRQAVRLDPDDEDSLTMLARALLAQDKDQEVVECIKHVQSLGASNEFLDALLGTALYKLGDASGALPLFQRSVERDPIWAYAHAWLAYTLGALDRWPEAVTHAARAASLNPNESEYRQLVSDTERYISGQADQPIDDAPDD